MSVLLCAWMACALIPGPQAATPLKVEAKPAQEQPQEPKRPTGVPVGDVQLKPMFLPKELFVPEKGWKYEEAEEELPFPFSVQQMTGLTFGSRFEIGHGAYVKYLVKRLPDADKASQMVTRLLASRKASARLHQKQRSISGPDQGMETSQTLLDPENTPQEYDQKAVLRYGRYVVRVEGHSDMKVREARPKRGDRRWMAEPVYQTVLAAALERWKNYKTLLADVH